MSKENVIVFGATGAVGGAAAQEAAERGTKVWLAMRDPSKSISWLTKEQEDNGTYARVKADLSDPASVTEAIKKSNAKSAFVYMIHNDEGMRPAFEALKKAGVTWVVLLSSFTIQDPPEAYEAVDMIPYKHAQAEIALTEVGLAFAAVRPGFFASNLNVWFLPGIKTGEVNLYLPEITFDHIVPANIGHVAGALLTQPKPDQDPAQPEIAYVYGPQLISQEEVVHKIAKLMGKEVKINSLSEEEYTKYQIGRGLPEPLVKYCNKQWNETKKGDFHRGGYAKGVENISRYTGKQPITFDEYLESVKHTF